MLCTVHYSVLSVQDYTHWIKGDSGIQYEVIEQLNEGVFSCPGEINYTIERARL